MWVTAPTGRRLVAYHSKSNRPEPAGLVDRSKCSPPVGALPSSVKEEFMKKNPYVKKQLHELLYQALETERGGIKIYETALTCAQNKDLKAEWKEYLEIGRAHV
jgi:hypothetical protein